MVWFDDKDRTRDVLNHLGDKVPDSIRESAKSELRRRGFTEGQISYEDAERSK